MQININAPCTMDDCIYYNIIIYTSQIAEMTAINTSLSALASVVGALVTRNKYGPYFVFIYAYLQL